MSKLLYLGLCTFALQAVTYASDNPEESCGKKRHHTEVEEPSEKANIKKHRWQGTRRTEQRLGNAVTRQQMQRRQARLEQRRQAGS